MKVAHFSTEAEGSEYIRIAKFNDIDEEMAAFTIRDVEVEELNSFDSKLITSFISPLAEVPKEYKIGHIFRLVPPDEGDFSVPVNPQKSDNPDRLGLRHDQEIQSAYRRLLKKTSERADPTPAEEEDLTF